MKFSSFRGLCILLALVSAQAFDVRAADDEVRALKLQVDELKDTVRQLQERIKVLEGDYVAPRVAATPAPTSVIAKEDSLRRDVNFGVSSLGEHPSPRSKLSVDDSIVTLRKSWRMLAQDMTQDTVREVLGPPTKEMLINGKTVWYYHYAGLGAGSVFFRGDGHISSSQPPNIGWGF